MKHHWRIDEENCIPNCNLIFEPWTVGFGLSEGLPSTGDLPCPQEIKVHPQKPFNPMKLLENLPFDCLIVSPNVMA